MPALNATATVGLQYTPPGSAANSGTLSLSVTASCASQNVGQIDVDTSASPGDTFEVPFGSVNNARVLILKNSGTNEYGVKINGSGSAIFSLPPGGEFAFAASTTPSGTPITACELVVNSTPATVDYIQYYCFGD